VISRQNLLGLRFLRERLLDVDELEGLRPSGYLVARRGGPGHATAMNPQLYFISYTVEHKNLGEREDSGRFRKESNRRPALKWHLIAKAMP
jgi:hypothetical protein